MESEPIKQADRRACARQINRLLAACKNDVLVQNSAAAIIEDHRNGLGSRSEHGGASSSSKSWMLSFIRSEVAR